MSSTEDYFMVVEGLLSADECDMIIKEYEDSNLWKATGLYEYDKSITKCNADQRNDSNVVNRDETCFSILISRVKDRVPNGGYIDKLLFERSGIAVRLYTNKNKWCSVTKDEGYELLKFSRGNNLNIHVDNTSVLVRNITLSIALSDDYVGGEWYFPNEDKHLKISKGGALMFPSNFLFPHCIKPIESGTRYSVVTWFV